MTQCTIERELYEPCRGEKAVWTSVITQAVLDAKSACVKSQARAAKLQAFAWFETSDFDDVCELADLEPNSTRQKIYKALATGAAWRLPAGQGWRAKQRLLKETKANQNHL